MSTTLRAQDKRHENGTSATNVLPARVVVISDALAERNGVGTYYQDLVEQLRDRIEHISLIAPVTAPKAPHEWFSIPLPGDTTQQLVFPRPRVLRRLIDEQSPSVIVIPTLGPYTHYALRIARRKKIPVCVAHHTNFEGLVDLYWNPLLAGMSRGILRWMTNRLMRRGEAIATMNVESFEDAIRRGGRGVRKMGTPVAASFVREPRQGLNMNPPRIIFLGRLAAEKGIEKVLEAAQRLPEFQFRIAGDGPLRQRVESEAKQRANLHYLGWLPRAQVMEALDASDLLVLPSRLETFGTVALEALARRRLVLVTPTCGVTDWPELATGLFTIQPDEDLTMALSRIARLSADERDSIASRAWSAVERFNDETIDGWLRMIADVSGATMPDLGQARAAG